MNYVGEMTARLAGLLDDCPPELLRLYALLALVKGGEATLEDVHDAWAAWRTVTRPDHPALVPFGQLAPSVQELDRKYMEAIREAARSL
jgi:hypothetical protein